MWVCRKVAVGDRQRLVVEPIPSLRRFEVNCVSFPLMPPCLARATDIGMVGGPGYEVERCCMWYAFSILFSRECQG